LFLFLPEVFNKAIGIVFKVPKVKLFEAFKTDHNVVWLKKMFEKIVKYPPNVLNANQSRLFEISDSRPTEIFYIRDK